MAVFQAHHVLLTFCFLATAAAFDPFRRNAAFEPELAARGGLMLLSGAPESVHEAFLAMRPDFTVTRPGSLHTAMRPDSSALVWDSRPWPGGWSRGTLSVLLDPADPDSPVLKLRVRMKFAKKQPAPHGPLLLHCGGPGSDDDCATYVVGDEPKLYEGYDVWSIAQRGMGVKAEPAILCAGEEHSRLPSSCPPEGCKISDFTTCPCALLDGTKQIGEIWADVNYQNKSEVDDLMRKMFDWGDTCYKADKWQLHGQNGKMYNFLDYVGTQYLAYDIDSMRLAIGAPRMSIYGFSYGTYVGGVYATVFKDVVDKVVLDGNMSPWPEKEIQGHGDALANDKAIAKLLMDCKRMPANCSLHDPETEYDAVVKLATMGQLTAPTKSGKKFELSPGMLMAYLQFMYTSNTGLGFPKCTQTLAKLSPRNSDEKAREAEVAKILNGFCMVQDVPTWYNYDVCVGPGQTMADEGANYAETYLEQCAVWGVDQAGLFRVHDAMGRWQSAKQVYSDAGLAAEVGDLAGYGFWPAIATPTAPIGNPDVRALVIGNLYDTATSYSWSQQMRQAFGSGALLTWQGVGHTLPSPGRDNYDPEALKKCRSHVTNYLQYGTLPLDGYVCHTTKPVPVG
mmetsp:Transcript_74677/g.192708  ORF Transcript_74677/g.192708 Transcript_74677/m.192708 type:complete len:621 (-) Transcript_74677:226-2088(-)